MSQPPPEAPRQTPVAFELTSLARGRRRRIDLGWIVIGLVVALVAAAIAHPWQSANPIVAVVPRPSTAPSPGPVVTPARDLASGAPAPVARAAQTPSDVLASNVYQLGGPAAPWGVGVGAQVGPPRQPTLRIPALGVATADAWWAWIQVHPLVGRAATAAVPSATIKRLSVTKLCAGVPDLPSGAQVLEITTSAGTPDLVEVAGWHEVGWHDEPRDIEPLPQLDDLVLHRTGNVTYLELADGAAWPDGRYQVQTDRSESSSPASLTVFLGQP